MVTNVREDALTTVSCNLSLVQGDGIYRAGIKQDFFSFQNKHQIHWHLQIVIIMGPGLTV